MTSEVTIPPPHVGLSSIISVVKHDFPNGGNKLEVKSVVKVASNGTKKTKSQDSRQSKVSKLSYSAEKPVLLRPFGHQVSGRASILCYDETTLLKPYVSRELYFYQSIPKDLKKFTPQFRGLITVSFIEDSRTSSMLAYALPHTLVKPDAKSLVKLFAEEPKPHSKRCVKDFGKTHVIYPSKSKDEDSENQDSYSLNENDNLFVTSEDLSNSPMQFANNSGADEDDVVSELSQGFEMNVSINGKKAVTGEAEPPPPSTGLQNPWNSKVLDAAWVKLKYNESEHHSSGRKKRFALLENVVARYRRPCVLDLKIGTRVRENASPEKIARHVTAINLGARLSGMQIYNRHKEQFSFHNKYYGHNLTISGFKSNLRHFFSRGTIPVRKTLSEKKENSNIEAPTPAIDRNLVRRAVEKLSEMRDIVGAIQSHRFYSSSLLLLYEGDIPKEGEIKDKEEGTPMDTAEQGARSPETKPPSRTFSFSEFLQRLKNSQHKHRCRNNHNNNSPKIHDLQGHDSVQGHDRPEGQGHTKKHEPAQPRQHTQSKTASQGHEALQGREPVQGRESVQGREPLQGDNNPLRTTCKIHCQKHHNKSCNHGHSRSHHGYGDDACSNDSKNNGRPHQAHGSSDKLHGDSGDFAPVSHGSHERCEQHHGDFAVTGRKSRETHDHNDNRVQKSLKRDDGDSKKSTDSCQNEKKREESSKSNTISAKETRKTHKSRSHEQGDSKEKSVKHEDSVKRHEHRSANGSRKSHKARTSVDEKSVNQTQMHDTRPSNKSWPRTGKEHRSSHEADPQKIHHDSGHHREVQKQPIQREDLKRRHNEVSIGNGDDIIDVRMIDFAHYCFHDNEMHPGPDGGFLFGLDNLIALLNDMLK